MILSPSDPRSARVGSFYALIAFTSWGLFPAYWRLLHHVPPVMVIAHRVFWSAAFYYLLLRSQKNVFRLSETFADRNFWKILASALLIGTNWTIYIIAVNTGHVLETSLGYFINPLVNVFLGSVFLGERLRKLQWVSVALATVGVVQLTLHATGIPWIALSLALTFAFYGLVRKQIHIAPLKASTLEGFFLCIPALVWIFTDPQNTGFSFLQSPWDDQILLILGGIVTGLPLVWFAYAAERLPLSILGFFQYLAPTFQFLLALFLFKEPFSHSHLLGFIWIWAALALFLFETWRNLRISARTTEP